MLFVFDFLVMISRIPKGNSKTFKSKSRTTRSTNNVASRFMVMIINAFQKSNDSNPLSPSLGQAIALDDLSQKDIYEWVEMIEVNELDKYLFSVGHYNSLVKRVERLCELLTKDGNIKPLVMMDGHGRTLYFIIICLIHMGYTQEDIENKIKVVDIDDGAIMWHEKFFPSGVICDRSNIFDTYEKEMKINPDTVFYFNFCGIKSEENSIKCRQILSTNSNVMLSFSMERAAKTCKYINELQSFCDKNCDLIDDGRRNEFPTYISK